jgi:acyl-CoA hydrolase
VAICSDDGRTDTRPPLLVTASVDAIDLRKRLRVATDMTMTGEVVWTGSSSMDIRMELLQVLLPSLLQLHISFVL